MKSKTTINFNGVDYDFELNLNAMINFEEETGTSLMNINPEDEFSLVDIRGLLWAGLNEHTDITVEEAGKLINISNMQEVSEKIMTVYEESIPESNDESNGESQGKNKNRSIG